MSESANQIIETLKKADNEGTESPWWMVIDPGQLHGILECVAEHQEVPDIERVITAIAFSVEGPFFCRDDAEAYLKSRAYDYSKNTIVWCGSGYRSQKYKSLCRELRLGSREGTDK